MILGPITHAGSQWRKLCARYDLDPEAATAGDVEKAIGRIVLAPIKAADDQISRALDESEEWKEWDHLSGKLQEALGNMTRAIDAAMTAGSVEQARLIS